MEMKVNIEGMEIECTVEEFELLAKLFGTEKEKEKLTPFQELQRLEHWYLKEIEVDGGIETTAVLVSKGAVDLPKQKKTSIEAIGEFWRARRDFD